jgi:hypothetical protein
MTLPLKPETEPRFFQKLAEAEAKKDPVAAPVTALWPAPGVYHGMKPADYHATREIDGTRIASKSLLWDFFPNPRRWNDSPPKEVTAAMRWGSLVDCLTLTPSLFAESYVVAPETYLAPESAKKDAPMIAKPWNWNANACKAWRDERPDKEIVTADDLVDATKAMNRLLDHPAVASMMDGAATQVAMRFDSYLHGDKVLPLKGLLDIVPSRLGEWGDTLVDLKEIGQLDDIRGLERTIYERGYHAQAALYLDMWNALTGEKRKEFVFVFQLSSAPWEVAIVRLKPEAFEVGRDWYQKAARKWVECITTDIWPSPWDHIQEAGLPAYAYGKDAA